MVASPIFSDFFTPKLGEDFYPIWRFRIFFQMGWSWNHQIKINKQLSYKVLVSDCFCSSLPDSTLGWNASFWIFFWGLKPPQTKGIPYQFPLTNGHVGHPWKSVFASEKKGENTWLQWKTGPKWLFRVYKQTIISHYKYNWVYIYTWYIGNITTI